MDITEFDKRILSLKDRLYRLARGMLGSGAEADDAVQDILEKLWRRRDTLSGNVEALAYTATRNLCIDRIRGRKQQTSKAPERGFDPLPAIEIRDMRAMVERMIADLPEKQQLVIHLRDVEGCEFDEIAAAVGMDQAAVRATLSRARKTVRERLMKIMDYGL